MRDELQEVLLRYPTARQEDLTSHPVAALISHELADEIRELVDSDSYRVTGSPGRGNWAETPWVSVFDPARSPVATANEHRVTRKRRAPSGDTGR